MAFDLESAVLYEEPEKKTSSGFDLESAVLYEEPAQEVSAPDYEVPTIGSQRAYAPPSDYLETPKPDAEPIVGPQPESQQQLAESLFAGTPEPALPDPTSSIEFKPSHITKYKDAEISPYLGDNVIAKAYERGKSTVEKLIGKQVIGVGEKMQKEQLFEVDQLLRGSDKVKEYNLDPMKIEYIGSVPILPDNITEQIGAKYQGHPEDLKKQAIQQDKEDVTSYLMEVKRRSEGEVGKLLKESGEKEFGKGEARNPLSLRVDKLMENVEKYKKRPEGLGLIKAAIRGDLRFVSEAMIGEAIYTGDSETLDYLVNVKKRANEELGKNHIKPAGAVMKVLHGIAEMLPPMVKSGAKGAVSGGTLSMYDWARQGAGDAYVQMVDAGVSRETAQGIAKVSGIFYAGIEQIQVGQLANIGGGVSKKLLKKSLLKYIVKLGLNKTRDVGKEILEEGAQRFITDFSVEMGKQTDGLSDKKLGEFLKEEWGNVQEEMIEVAPEMIGLTLLGLPVGLAGAVSKYQETGGITPIDLDPDAPFEGDQTIIEPDPDAPIETPGKPSSAFDLETAEETSLEFDDDVISQIKEPVKKEDRRQEDRRVDVEKRLSIGEMTEEEAKKALSSDEKTGLGSERAWNDNPRQKAQGIADVDGLKTANDRFGYKFGDKLIIAYADSFKDAEGNTGVKAYRIGGDELRFEGPDKKTIDKVAKKAYNILQGKTITFKLPDNSTVKWKGMGFSYGTAENQDSDAAYSEAEAQLHKSKADRQKAGIRPSRGEDLRGISVTPPGGDRDSKRDVKSPAKEPEPSPVLSKEEEQEILTGSRKKTLAKEELVEGEPSEAQKEAGNYQKEHIRRDGYEISIENPSGSVRSGVSESGKKWSTKMHQDYGYIRGTKGADWSEESKDQVDVFIKPGSKEGGAVFIVNQNNPKTGKFDEHKVMMGFESQEAAEKAYLSNYEKGWKGLGSIVEMPADKFKEWVYDGIKKDPAKEVEGAEYFGYSATILKKRSSEVGATQPVYNEEFNKLLPAEKFKRLTEEKRLITQQIEENKKLGVENKNGILIPLRKALDKEQAKHSKAKAENARLEKNQLLRYTQTGKPHTIGLETTHDGVLRFLEKDDIQQDPKVLNEYLTNKYTKRELLSAIKSIKNEKPVNRAAYEIRKEIGGYIQQGAKPTQTIDVIKKKQPDEGPLFSKGEQVDDLFADTELAPDKKKTKQAADRTEVKLRKEQRKGGRADLEGLPAFKGKEIEGTEQTVLFSKEIEEIEEIEVYSGTYGDPASKIVPLGQTDKTILTNYFGGIFGSEERDVAESHGDNIQKIKSKNHIASDDFNSELLYDPELSKKHHNNLKRVMKDVFDSDLTKSEVENLMDYVAESEHIENYRIDYDDDGGEIEIDEPEMGGSRFADIFNFSSLENNLGEIGWHIQGVKGELARRTGYTSVGMQDEHGESVLVLTYPEKADIGYSKEIEDALTKRGITGDDLLNEMDKLEEIKEGKGVVDKKGNVVLYHRTPSKESADAIVKTGQMTSKEDGLFFSTRPTGQNEGYGKFVVKVTLPIENLEVNDVFGDETHLRYPTKSIGKMIPVGKAELFDITKPEIRYAKEVEDAKPQTEREKISKIIESIESDIGYDEWIGEKTDYPYYAYGIRQVRTNKIPSEGDILPQSYNLSVENWEDLTKEELEEYKLSGTSAVNISNRKFKDDPQKTILEVLNQVKSYKSMGEKEKYVLIRGVNMGTLDDSDPNEIIIDEAEVVASISTHTDKNITKADIRYSKEVEDAKPQTETPAFKKWFGDSKVVDEDGKPLVVYHGTSTENKFTKFRGFSHFGTLEQAKYIIKDDTDGRVYPVYLSIKKPLRIKDTPMPESMLSEVINAGVASWQEFYKKGYDGLVYKNEIEGDGDSWVAVNSIQIKSATGNLGTFDPTKADIRYSKGQLTTFQSLSEVDVQKFVSPELWNKIKIQKMDSLYGKDNEHSFDDIDGPPVNGAIWIEEGQIYVAINPNISLDEQSNTLVHEIMGHAGIANVLDTNPKISKRINLLYRASKKTPLMDKIRKKYDPQEYYSEWLAANMTAHIAARIANPKKRGLAYDVYMAVRRFLIEMGFATDSVEDFMQQMAKDIKTLKNVKTKIFATRKSIQDEAPAFYSPTYKNISELKQEKGVVQQIQSMIKKGQLKKAEVEWLGLEEYLQENPKATKSEVLDFVRSNQVEVEESELGGVDYIALRTELYKKYEVGSREDFDEVATDEEMERLDVAYESAENDQTKYSQYTLPGGENYRELLFKMPKERKVVIPRDYKTWSENQKRLNKEEEIYEEKEVYETTIEEYEKYKKELATLVLYKDQYKSSHWEEPNVFAHARVNDRTTPEGEKVLFIEEIQSDWAREAREKGIKLPQAEIDKLDKRREALEKEGLALKKEGKEITSEKRQEWTDIMNKMGGLTGNERKVPDFPHRKNWQEFVLKKILRQAAEQGYDRVAWVSGEQTADRYDLSKQLKAVRAIKQADNKYVISYQTNNNDGYVGADVYSAEKLPDVVGKDLAKKILNQKQEMKDYTGLDLKIGGEWAKNLYDKQIPQFLKKYTKKWGGKVDDISMGVTDLRYNAIKQEYKWVVLDRDEGWTEGSFETQKEAEDYAKKMNEGIPRGLPDLQQSISITPEMRKSVVYEGQPLFSKKLPPAKKRQLADIYTEVSKDVKKPGFFTPEKSFRKVKENVLADLLVPVSTRLRKIAPVFKKNMRQFEYMYLQQQRKDMLSSSPFLDGYKKMNRGDQKVFDIALKNADIGKVDEILVKYKLQKEYAAVRKTLDDIHERATEVGFNMNYIEEYFPRSVLNPTGLLEYVTHTEEWGMIEGAIKTAEEKAKRPLSEKEKTDLINMFISRPDRIIHIPGATQERTIDVIDKEMDKFYDYSVSSLVKYIHDMNHEIEVRRFLGMGKAKQQFDAIQPELFDKDGNLNPAAFENVVDNQINDITAGIDQYVLDAIEKHDLTAAQQDQLIGIFRARFNYQPSSNIIQLIKNLGYIGTMGSGFSSAITQIGDLAFAYYVAGPRYATVSLTKGIVSAIPGTTVKQEVSKEDLGLERIGEEFRTTKGLGKALNKIFQLTGLTGMDSLGKETLINGMLMKMRHQARKGSPKLTEEIRRVYGSEMDDQIIQDLKDGKISEDIKYMLFSRILDFQPMTMSEMPLTYLKAKNGRIFYMLKTFTIKALDAFRNEGLSVIKAGVKEKNPAKIGKGLRDLVYLAALFTLANAGADEIKDWIFNRQTSMKDKIWDNILRLFGLSRYIAYEARREGPVTAAAKMVTPPVPFVEDPLRDIWEFTKKDGKATGQKIKNMETWKNIPFFGKHYYWWFGGGAEKVEKRRAKNLGEAYEDFNDTSKDLDRIRKIYKKLKKEGNRERYLKYYDKHRKALSLTKTRTDSEGKDKPSTLNKRKSKIKKLKDRRKKALENNNKDRVKYYDERIKLKSIEYNKFLKSRY